MPEIEIRFRTEAEYRRLRSIRDKYGVQWRGMLIQGARRLEGRELRFALEPVDHDTERRPLESDVADRGDRSPESSNGPETNDSSARSDTSITDHRLDSRLFNENGTLQTAEPWTDRMDGDVAEFDGERTRR